MVEQITPLDRMKEMAAIENARMHRRMIGRDDMHAYMDSPFFKTRACRIMED